MRATDRVAFSPGEFAALFGKSQTWGYRQMYAGKVKAITEHGRFLIPAAEVERILGEAGTYDGLKLNIPKRGSKLNSWRRFLAERGKSKNTGASATARPVLGKLSPSDSSARRVALARLARGR